MFEEMLGELNGSHLGITMRAESYNTDSHVTGHPGLEFDPEYPGPGLKITHITYQGPCDQPGVELAAGDVVLKIDDRQVDNTWRWWELLTDRQGKPTRLYVLLL